MVSESIVSYVKDAQHWTADKLREECDTLSEIAAAAEQRSMDGEAALARATAEAATLREVLKNLDTEWPLLPMFDESKTYYGLLRQCPHCRGEIATGHFEACRVGIALSATPLAAVTTRVVEIARQGADLERSRRSPQHITIEQVTTLLSDLRASVEAMDAARKAAAKGE